MARYRTPAGWSPRTPIGLTLHAVTRVELERAVRRRVAERAELRATTVDDLVCDGGTVVGVSAEEGEIDADLVVEASGRTSKLPAWLRDAGFPRPDRISVVGGCAYTSRVFRPPSSPEWTTLAELPRAPDSPRGGVMVVTEDGDVLVTLMGSDGHRAPTGDEGFLDYARTLRSPDFADLVATARPVGPAHRMARLDSHWTLFHRMPRWPGHLLALGDAVCTLNPVYGQGMTVATTQAELLRGLLDRGRGGLEARFQRGIARALALPWAMATTADAFWDPRPTPLPARLAQWYLDRLDALIPFDDNAFRRFFHTAHLTRGPATLLHPGLLWKALRVSPARQR
ncbi:hypothetical protein ACOBQX_05095 [Actinokineospora sp. G85]|uniref:hypothetical protein n=1 Tax=Actinokineospora sp. G85 TaxID=3406626 RepID=UPI003C728E6E